MTIRRMCIARRVPNAINTLPVYVIYTACPLQQRLHKLALMLRYTYIACHLTTQFHLICSSVLCRLFATTNFRHASISKRPSHCASVRPWHTGEKRYSTLTGYNLGPGYRRVVRFTHHVSGVQTMNSTRSEASSGCGRFREENNELSLPDMNLQFFRTFTL